VAIERLFEDRLAKPSNLKRFVTSLPPPDILYLDRLEIGQESKTTC